MTQSRWEQASTKTTVGDEMTSALNYDLALLPSKSFLRKVPASQANATDPGSVTRCQKPQ